MIFYLIILVLLLWVLRFRYKRRRMYELASRISSAKELPIIGIAYKFTGNTTDIMTNLKELNYEAFNKNGILKGWFGHFLFFLMTDAVDVELILRSCLEKDDIHRFARDLVGNGGLFAPVAKWRKRRKIMVPAFSPKVLDNFVDIFCQHSDKLVELLSVHDKAGKFGMWPYISSFTLDSVCETALGAKINSQGNPDTQFLKSINAMLNVICKRSFHPFMHPNWLFKWFPEFNVLQENAKVTNSFVNTVIKNKRQQLSESRNENHVNSHQFDTSIESYRLQSFLELLINLSGGEKGYTDDELREEIMTLTVAGTDTSAVAICYVLKLLAKYPEVQDKVHRELYAVFGKSKRRIIKKDLSTMSYMERVIKETLRLFPPVPFITRKMTHEIVLPSGRVLPAGSCVIISIWGIHRDPKFWGPDADKFDPDRFLPERFTQVNRYSFVPFSSGPRNCLGYKYAYMAMKIVLSSILRTYKVVADPETRESPQIRDKYDIMMKDADGYQMALERKIE